MTVEIGATERVLVTGASGFVGSAVLAELLARGKSVRALVRATSPLANLPREGIEIVQGDLRDPKAMTAAMQGVRYLFHVAADYRLWARDPGEIMTANVEGTRNVMQAASQAGVARIVYTSSVATLALREGAAADESVGLDENQAIGAYKRSKIAAERLVEEMIGQGLPAVIVNPSTPIGPRDGRPTPTGRILIEAARGRMPAYVDTGLNLVHVDDVAAEDVALGDMLAEIAAMVGRKPPRVKLPRAPLFPLALAAETIAHFTGREPFATRDGLRMAKYRMFFSSAKAERELGYRHRPWREGLRDALAWFRQDSRLP